MVLSHPRIQRRPSLAAQVYDALAASIATGTLGPGERIVVDRLADQLGVSPTPVREALARLIQEGLIDEEANGRLRVVPLTQRYVFDIFLVRGAIEGLAAELAAPRIAESQLAMLREALERTATALTAGDYALYAATDTALHRAVCEAANNQVLTRELHALRVHVDYIRGYSQRHSGDHIRLSHAEHELVLDALTGRDPGTARRVMEQHIRSASERIAQLIDFRETHRP